MRKSISSLLVALLVLTLAVRGMAAPLLHLHDVFGPETVTATVQMEAPGMGDTHCHAAEKADAVDCDSQHHAHSDGHKDKHPLTGSKICDASGACCGSLAVLAMSMDPDLPTTSEQPLVPRPIIGIGPASPDRPPSPRIA